MKTVELSSWEFERELRIMAINCIRLKPNTVKKKVADILKKYQTIIEYSSSSKGYYEREYRKQKTLFDTLKSGVIYYKRDKVVGRLLLKDIEQVEVREKDVLIITKTNREIILGSTFEYLIELL